MVVEQADDEPLLRMGARDPPFPNVVGVAVRSKAGAALRRTEGNATHPSLVRLRPAPAPGFAHRWLELAEAAPWPSDEGNAAKALASLEEKNAGSAERLAFARAAHANRVVAEEEDVGRGGEL